MENIDNNGASVNNSPETDTTQDYISAINEIKQNTVSKDQYLKLKEDNRKLLDSLVNGGQLEKEEIKKPVDIEGLRNDLFGDKPKQMNNLDFISNALKLRIAIIENGGLDPFVPTGHKVQTTHNDYESAQRVADVLQECVDYADGNPEVFNDELKRRIN